MALNIRLNVGVATDFQSAVSSRVDNRIQLGDGVPQASLVSTSDLGAPGAADDAPGAVAPASDYAAARRGAYYHPAPRERTAALEQNDAKAPTKSQAVPPASPRIPYGAANGSTDAAIRDAAEAAGVDVNTMRGIASIESSMNPASNRTRRTQYKGLFQLGRDEWRHYGAGDIYNAHDNAMATARMFADHKAHFRALYGRDPTDRELYMIHQQGLGFFTRGAMTNIGGNPYPGMRGPQTHDSFMAGWGRELERRKEAFARRSDGRPPVITLGDIGRAVRGK